MYVKYNGHFTPGITWLVWIFQSGGRGRGVANSELELPNLILHEDTFPEMCKSTKCRIHITGSDNNQTIAWTFKEATSVNLMMTDLLRICSIVNTNSFIAPTVFYHPGTLSTVVDDTSRRFDLPHSQFLSLFSCKYHSQRSSSSWTGYHPPNDMISSVISTLHMHQSGEVTFLTIEQRPYTNSGSPSIPISRLTTGFRNLESLPSKFFKCTGTGSVTTTTPNSLVLGRTRL